MILFISLLSGIGAVQVIAQGVSPASDFEYDLNEEGTGVVIQGYKGWDKNIVIPAFIEDFPVVYIASRTFNESNIVSVVIPDSVTGIGGYCFANCKALRKVVLSKNIEWLGWGVFAYCTSLKNIELPNNIVHIPIDAFAYSGLESITIPDSVLMIGVFGDAATGPFSGCKNLKTVTIGNGTEVIGWDAFSGCSSLTTVTIGSGIKAILRGAFASCSSLTTFNIGVEKLEKGSETSWTLNDEHIATGYEDNVFTGCSALSLKEKKKIRDTGYTGGF